MNKTEVGDSRLNQFAGDIIRGHADRCGLRYIEEIEKLLIRILPAEVKSHPVALRKAVEVVPYSHFNQGLRVNALENLTFDQFSNDAVEDLHHMYSYQDRTLYYFAIAEWATDRRTRLTSRQIELWEIDDNKRTQRLSDLHAKGARACIDEGSIVIDDQFTPGVYTPYKLDSGIYHLLEPGIEDLKTYEGKLSLDDAKAFALDELQFDRLFVRVPYQTT
jgi:hypothetical protein